MNEVKDAKMLAELSKKLDAEKKKLDTDRKMLEKRIRDGSDTSMKAIDVKYDADRVKSIQKEIDRLK